MLCRLRLHGADEGHGQRASEGPLNNAVLFAGWWECVFHFEQRLFACAAWSSRPTEAYLYGVVWVSRPKHSSVRATVANEHGV